MAVHALTVIEVADRLGLAREKVRSMVRRGRFAEADVVIGGTSSRPIHGWTPETVDAWKASEQRAN